MEENGILDGEPGSFRRRGDSVDALSSSTDFNPAHELLSSSPPVAVNPPHERWNSLVPKELILAIEPDK